MPTDTSPTLKMKTSRPLPTRISPDALREKTPGAVVASDATASAIVSSRCRRADGRMPVYKRLNGSAGFIDSFLNDPPPGFRKNSVQLTLGVTYVLP